jgi:hypothetical protein
VVSGGPAGWDWATGGACRVRVRQDDDVMLPVRLSSVSEVQPGLVLWCGEFMWPRQMVTWWRGRSGEGRRTDDDMPPMSLSRKWKKPRHVTVPGRDNLNSWGKDCGGNSSFCPSWRQPYRADSAQKRMKVPVFVSGALCIHLRAHLDLIGRPVVLDGA